MTPEQLTKLKDGDIIRNLSSGDAYNVLRNIGSTVIAARTLEVTNAPEWEHVYTTTPVKAEPAPGILEMIEALELRCWKYSRGYWVAPDGFEEHSLHRAYELRDEHRVLSIWDKINELDAAGWKRVGCSGWEQPGTTCVYNGADTAWHRMDKLRSEKLVTPPIVSFQDARAALWAAGWRNVFGKVWCSPSEVLFDGTRAAYDAMKKI